MDHPLCILFTITTDTFVVCCILWSLSILCNETEVPAEDDSLSVHSVRKHNHDEKANLRSKEAFQIFLDRLTAQRSELGSKTESSRSLLSNLYAYLNLRGFRRSITENETTTAFVKARIQFSTGPFDPITEEQIVQLGGNVSVYRRQQETIQSKIEEQYEIRRRLSSAESCGCMWGRC